jgi:hypothetical protein
LANSIPDLLSINPDLVNSIPDLLNINPDLVNSISDLLSINPDLVNSIPDLLSVNPELFSKPVDMVVNVAINPTLPIVIVFLIHHRVYQPRYLIWQLLLVSMHVQAVMICNKLIVSEQL